MIYLCKKLLQIVTLGLLNYLSSTPVVFVFLKLLLLSIFQRTFFIVCVVDYSIIEKKYQYFIKKILI